MLSDANQQNNRYLISLLVLVVCVLSIVGPIRGQETVELLDALAIVRDTYGSDVVVAVASYNMEFVCWEFEFEDSNTVCVSDSTGEFVYSREAETGFPGEGLVLLGGLITAVVLGYVWIRRSASPQSKPALSDGDSVTTRRIEYSVNRITIWLAAIACYLAFQSILARALQEWINDAPRFLDRFVRFVNINLENSLPTWYGSVLLLLAAVLVFIIARSKNNNLFRGHWYGLAIIFCILSVDEATSIHEELTLPLRDALGTSGFLHFAWVIVGAIFFGVVVLTYLRFLFHLPVRIRNLIILAAGLFVGGALVVESYSANLYAESGTTLLYSAIGTVEELLEMLGALLFIRAMLLYLREYVGDVQIGAAQDASWDHLPIPGGESTAAELSK